MGDKYSDDGFYDTDDEEWDAPITASWGVAAAAPVTPEDIDQTGGSGDVKSWHTIADPNAKIRADGVGAGNLHRKGKNFQPVDEQQILNQRLGKAVPKSKTKQVAVSKRTTKVSIQPFAGNKAPHVMSAVGMGKKAAKKARQSAIAMAAERARAIEKEAAAKHPVKPVAHPDPHVGSLWKAGGSLVDTPFWEQASSRQSIHAPARAPARVSAPQASKERKPQAVSQPAPPKEPIKRTAALAPEPKQSSAPKVEFKIKGAAESIRKVKAANTAAASDMQTMIKSGTREITIEPPKQQPVFKFSGAAQATAPVQPFDFVPVATTPPGSSSAPAPAPAPPKPAKAPQPPQAAKVAKPAATKPESPSPNTAPVASKGGVGSSDSRWASTPSTTSSTTRNPAADNPIIVTLNIELEKGEALPIIVRAKDDPKELATAFVERLSRRKNNIPIDNNIVQALTQLIEQKIRDKRI
ncbi:hypothetical protein VKS41_003384 [Umbelopsis sp. WA50703]